MQWCLSLKNFTQFKMSTHPQFLMKICNENVEHSIETNITIYKYSGTDHSDAATFNQKFMINHKELNNCSLNNRTTLVLDYPHNISFRVALLFPTDRHRHQEVASDNEGPCFCNDQTCWRGLSNCTNANREKRHHCQQPTNPADLRRHSTQLWEEFHSPTKRKKKQSKASKRVNSA